MLNKTVQCSRAIHTEKVMQSEEAKVSIDDLIKLADRTRWHRADEWPPEDGVYILMIDGKWGKPYVGTGLFDAYLGGFFRHGGPIDVLGWAYYPAGEEAILYG